VTSVFDFSYIWLTLVSKLSNFYLECQWLTVWHRHFTHRSPIFTGGVGWRGSKSAKFGLNFATEALWFRNEVRWLESETHRVYVGSCNDWLNSTSATQRTGGYKFAPLKLAARMRWISSPRNGPALKVYQKLAGAYTEYLIGGTNLAPKMLATFRHHHLKRHSLYSKNGKIQVAGCNL